jgi:citrate synthase
MSTANATTTQNGTATTTPSKPPFVKGLDGVVAVQTEISSVDGPGSTLCYRGINVHELAETATYEEVAYLLLHGKLPSRGELADFNARLVANRWLPAPMMDLLKSLPRDTVPMEALRTAVSALSFYDPEIEDISIEATQRKAVRLIAQLPTLCAAYEALRKGKSPIAPNPRLSHAANTLLMLGANHQDPDMVRAMDLYYILLADHGMNASTFTARVVSSTQSDLHSAISSAFAALKGPLHGGANEATMYMLQEIDQPNRVDMWVDNAFATKRKIMGIGHRIYKNGDPRSTHLIAWAEKLGRKLGQVKWYDMSRMVENAVLRHRDLHPNVDFYSASMMYYVGVPIDLFTPMFACSRVAGWCAHVIEQYKDNVLIRPQSEYVGPTDQHYVPLSER